MQIQRVGVVTIQELSILLNRTFSVKENQSIFSSLTGASRLRHGDPDLKFFVSSSIVKSKIHDYEHELLYSLLGFRSFREPRQDAPFGDLVHIINIDNKQPAFYLKIKIVLERIYPASGSQRKLTYGKGFSHYVG